MKICFKCGETKQLEQFYRHKRMADGYLGKCKECAKSDVAAHRLQNLERIREYDRERNHELHRIKNISENARVYRLRFPERYKANRAVAEAVRKGTLVKLPCAECGASKVQGHHPDYARPLDVIWLCAAHHTEIHLAYAH